MVSQNGLSYPVVTAGVGKNPQASAYETQQQNAQTLSKLGKVGGGVVVPQMTIPYSASNGSNDPNAQMKGLASVSTQQYANAKYDSAAKISGGKKKKKKNIFYSCKNHYSRKKSNKIKKTIHFYFKKKK